MAHTEQGTSLHNNDARQVMSTLARGDVSARLNLQVPASNVADIPTSGRQSIWCVGTLASPSIGDKTCLHPFAGRMKWHTHNMHARSESPNFVSLQKRGCDTSCAILRDGKLEYKTCEKDRVAECTRQTTHSLGVTGSR